MEKILIMRKTVLIIFALLILSTVVIIGCDNHTLPYIVDREIFYERVKKLGILPIYINKQFPKDSYFADDKKVISLLSSEKSKIERELNKQVKEMCYKSPAYMTSRILIEPDNYNKLIRFNRKYIGRHSIGYFDFEIDKDAASKMCKENELDAILIPFIWIDYEYLKIDEPENSYKSEHIKMSFVIIDQKSILGFDPFYESIMYLRTKPQLEKQLSRDGLPKPYQKIQEEFNNINFSKIIHKLVKELGISTEKAYTMVETDYGRIFVEKTNYENK